MFKRTKHTPTLGKAGWYLHVTVEGITHLRFERTETESHETYRALLATFNVEPKIVEVAA